MKSEDFFRIEEILGLRGTEAPRTIL